MGLTATSKIIAAGSGTGLAILFGIILSNRAAPPPPGVSFQSTAPARADVAPPAAAPGAPAPSPVATSAAPAAAPPPVATSAAPARPPQRTREGREGEVRHHRSAHAGMSEADRRAMQQSYQRATRAFDLGDYDEAIAAYKQTYLLGGDAPMLYNIAQALRLAHRPDEAIGYYRRYLLRAPAAPNREDVRAKIVALLAQRRGAKPGP